MPKKFLSRAVRDFSGSNLCARLLASGHQVVCLDNFQTGQHLNIQPFLSHPSFELIEQNVIEPIKVDDVQEIYNMACPASPPHYQKTPIETMKTNVLGALSVLEVAQRCKAKVLQASTSEVYGDPLEHPQKEHYNGNVNPTGPRACYDEGKRAAEALFFDYHRQYGTAIKVARIFNTYGPHMREDDGRVVSNFIRQALKNEPLSMYGNGEQTRSFCFVDDLIEGLIRLMDGDTTITGPINLGNPQEFTMHQLADEVLRLCPTSTSKIIYHPLPTDDPGRRRPDITQARTILGWEPRVSLTEGLARTIDYFRPLIKAAA